MPNKTLIDLIVSNDSQIQKAGHSTGLGSKVQLLLLHPCVLFSNAHLP